MSDGMQEQAETEVPEATEVAASETPGSLDDALAKLGEMMEADYKELTEDDTEQEPEDSDEEASDDDAGEAEESSQSETEEKPADGPTAAMKAMAKFAKVPERLIAIAKDDEQLQAFIDELGNAGEAKQEQEQEADPLEKWAGAPLFADDFSEDEFDADDPVVKRLKSMQEALNKEVSDQRKSLLHVKKLLDLQAQNEQLQQQQKEFAVLGTPFDEVLDEVGSAVLGKSGSLTDKQFQERAELFEAYKTVVEKSKAGPERFKEIAKLALQAKHPSLAKALDAIKQQTRQQAKSRTNGGAATPSKGQPTYREKMKHLEALMSGK